MGPSIKWYDRVTLKLNVKVLLINIILRKVDE